MEGISKRRPFGVVRVGVWTAGETLQRDRNQYCVPSPGFPREISVEA